MAIILRDARLEDAARLAEIYSHYVENTAISFEYVSPGAEEFRQRMQGFMKDYPYLVAEKDGLILGYAYAHAFVGRAAYRRSAELTIYLDRDAKKLGCGRALYEELEKRLRQQGILNLYACIGWVDEEDEYLNHNSADFHRHMGFELAGRFNKCGYKFGRWYDMIWVEKIIGEHK